MEGVGQGHKGQHLGKPDHVTVFLDDGMLSAAQARAHNFVAKMQGVLEGAGTAVSFESKSTHPMFTNRYTISHMTGPIGPNSVIFRRVVEYPFWHIDRDEKRWNWTTARAEFDAGSINPVSAQGFVDRQRKRLYGVGELAQDFILIPLQGRLLKHRSFQTASPISMIESVCMAYPDRTVIATLHPNEVYSNADHRALDQLGLRYKNLTVQSGGTPDLIKTCALVVTQNSSVAFTGYLFHKPAILFGKTDTHHIALGSGALGSIPKIKAEVFDAYVYWYWQLMCINGGHPDCEAHIKRDLQQSGWDI